MLGFVVCNTDHVAGVQLSPIPSPLGCEPYWSYVPCISRNQDDTLIALSRMAVCRLGSTITSTTKSLSQYKPFFALSLGFILLHQKKNHQTIVFLVPHVGFEPTNQKWCPSLNRVCLPIPPMGSRAEILGFEPRRSDSKSEMLPITSYLIIII